MKFFFKNLKNILSFIRECLRISAYPHIISLLGKYPETILKSSNSREVNKIANYLKSLSQLFHSYYGSTKFVSDEDGLRNARLLLLKCVSTVIEDGLDILGVSAPTKM